MSDHHHRRPAESESHVSANRGALLTTLVHLWPYIWPSDRRDLKQRVVWSLVLLLAAKLATIAVPFTFKWATDALAGKGTAPIAAADWLFWAIAAPIAMTIAYGGMRILMAALTQLRDGLFAKVAMHAVRRLAYRATEWRIGIRRKMNDSDTDANVKAIDSLLNYETVKYFSAEEREAARYDRSMARYEDASVRAYTSLAMLNAGQAVIFTCGLAAAMVMCAFEIKEGTKTVGDFVLINAMMIQLYQPLNFMGMVYREIKQAITDIEIMFSILAREPEIKDVTGAPQLRVTAGNIRFENVSFAYDPERPILRGITFDVPAGKTVAVVGPSGAGKSTISRLLFRFYDLSGGRILIDGQDIALVTQKSLRKVIGMVPQDTVLFNDTIRYNIRYGRWEATDAEVEEAARLAQIDSLIRMAPKGYETEVGERGLKLSGGEKQRVAIARTILKEPPILALDEATSALDSHTEKEIQDALERVSRNRTTLVIAHRLSTIVGADEIIVLDQGEIVERGTHYALLAGNGLYASMWNRQREAEEAREKLALAGEDEKTAPNRNPPPVDDPIGGADPLPLEARADAAE